MFKFLAKSSIGAMFGAVPPAAWYCLIAMALVMCGGWMNGLRWENKLDKHLAADAAAIELAKQVQLNDSTLATVKYIEVEGKTKTIVVERLKEVKVYEKNNTNNAPRVCAAGDTFGDEYERLFNNEPTALSATAH